MVVPGALSESGQAVLRRVAELSPGSLVVALSGGADSAVAAWACVASRPEGSVRLVHIDHGWPDSPALRVAAEAIAQRLELPLETVRVTPAAGPSPEGAAREVRLAALIEAAKGDRVVTGHHADDAAETVIANLLRGAGSTGLSGIAAERLPFIRPLIAFRRTVLRRLAEDLELPFLDDPSNEDLGIRRNLIRHRVIPELDTRIEGDLVELLNRTADSLAAEDGFLEDMTGSPAVVADGGTILLPVAPLVTSPSVLASRSIRMTLRQAHPPYPGSRREVDVVRAVVYGEQRRGDLSNGLVAEREGPFVAIYSPAAAEVPAAIGLQVPGEAIFGDHKIVACMAKDGSRAHLSHDWCRLALTRGDLLVRPTARGDRVEIDGGSKSVADAFGEAGIPPRKRSAWPVVESHGRIAWVAGVRTAAWARRETSATHWVEFERREA